MEEPLVMSARTVDEAVELALKELDVDRGAVEVEVLSRGKAGFLGIGAEPAQVRVSRRAAPDRLSPDTGARDTAAPDTGARDADAPDRSAADLATAVVGRLMEAAGVEVQHTVRSAYDADAGGPIIDLTGEDSGLLIGRRGQTLQALQFLVTLMVRRQYGEEVRVVLDVENYRQRRENSLRDMAGKVAARVVQTGRSITLEPMPPADRRVVHTFLTDTPGVRTESTGEGESRKVMVIPVRE